MANRVDGSALSRAGELFSIRHNPLPDVATIARRWSLDVECVVPFHVDPNWFDTIWYGQPRARRGIGAGIVRLMDGMRAVRARLPVRPVVSAAWQEHGR